VAEIKASLDSGIEIQIWFQDEARIGQKNKITRRWAPKGTRPRAPKDQRTQWAYIFGAICPAKGKGAGLVLPGSTAFGTGVRLPEKDGSRGDGFIRAEAGIGAPEAGDSFGVICEHLLVACPPVRPINTLFRRPSNRCRPTRYIEKTD
jgi:hypothetical protein